MDAGIIIALILGGCSIVSSICFGLIPTVRKNKIEKLERKVAILLRDLDSFYQIESILLDECAKSQETNRESLKRNVRSRVKELKNYSLSDYTTPANLRRELIRYNI